MHQWHLSSCILTTKNIIRTLLLECLPFLTFFSSYFEFFKRLIHTLHLLCLWTDPENAIVSFPYIDFNIEKHQWYLVCWFLPLNIFFLSFSGLLIWKCINYTYLAAVSTLNTPSTTYFFITIKNATFSFHAVFWPSKHQSYLSSYFETSKYLTRLPCFLFACFWITYLCCSLWFNLELHQRHLSCCIFTSRKISFVLSF